jgi:hypothetical protein
VKRRAFLQGSGSLGLLGLASPRRVRALLAAAPTAGEAGRFLTAHELDTLRALLARLLPGPPDDPDPGAVESGAPEAIDLLLGAFTVEPPLIHAGGPFSGRAGGDHDDFADFVPMDRLTELGWRIRLEGSLGIPEREFAGPVRGLQTLYREGLAHLDERAAPLTFATLPAPAQILVLQDQTDGQVQELVGAALADGIDAMYGPPEYGGNRELVGWTAVNWPGDVQPAGYTDVQVSGPDPTSGGASPPTPDEALATLKKFLPAVGGASAATNAWWLARPGLERG